MTASLAWWDNAIADVRARLAARDDEMQKQYLKRRDIAASDIREQVQPGDYVAVCVRTPSKLEARWKGPWLVLRVLGEHGTTLELMKRDGSTCVTAVANVKRWRGDAPPRPLKRVRAVEPVVVRKKAATGGAEWSSDSSESIDLSSDDEEE